MSRIASLLLLTVAATLLSSVASAEPSQAEAADTVHLRSGGSHRGRITEVLPGDHVTIVSEAGEPKRIPWSDIERLVLPSVTRSEAAAPIPAPAPPPPPLNGPLVRVHISSKAVVNLHRRPIGSVDWVEACVSPCDKELPAGDGYRITGTGIAEKELVLHADGAKTVEIRIDPPSTPGMVGGVALTVIGASAALLGFLMLPTTCMGEKAGCEQKGRDGTGTVGGILFASGAGAAVIGTLTFLFSSKTDVAVAVDGKERTPPSNREPNREPSWRGGSIEAPPMKLPFVFTRTF